MKELCHKFFQIEKFFLLSAAQLWNVGVSGFLVAGLIKLLCACLQAYVDSFSRNLYYENRHRGVCVQVRT